MKGVITVEVPDEALARRVDEMWKLFAGEGDPKPAPQDYFRERLEEIASDELRIAMFGWPMEIHVEVHGWFPTDDPEPPGDGLEQAYPGLHAMTDEDVRKHGTPEANEE